MRVLVVFQLFFGLCFGFAEDTFRYKRTYKIGEEFGYTLKTIVYHNKNFHSEEFGESIHTVTNTAIPYEQVVWKSLARRDQSGSRDLSADALRVRPYSISLDPAGSISLPALEIPNMVGMITDLSTFYVAISHKAGILKLAKRGDSFDNPDELKGEWASGTEVSVGQDCTKITLSLEDLTPTAATIRSSFLAPSAECIVMHKPWMSPPVKAGVPNNFQQVKKTGNTFLVMWGHEQFIIKSEVDRASGLIKYAEMNNTLTLKMKTGCSENLDNCQAEFPFSIERDEVLKAK